MMRDHDTAPTAGQTLPGGLRILDPMGSTPEGTLYHAEYPDGREVALLLAAPGSSEVTASRRERLERAIQIQHVNVARIYAAGELGNGSLYVVLEKLGGEPLSKLLAAGRVFSLPEALDLALQVAAGLWAAHRAGFVHGNLSPDTILVTEAGDGLAQIKLIGFELYPSPGQAGVALPVRTEASEYASPERLAGDPPDDRSDVFSLGAILHHLLTGMPPDSGEVDGSVPRVARDVLGAAMASAPVRRFHSIPEFHAALERLAGLTGKRSVPGRRRALERGAVGAALAALIAGASLIPRAESPPPTEQQPVARAPTPPTPQRRLDRRREPTLPHAGIPCTPEGVRRKPPVLRLWRAPVASRQSRVRKPVLAVDVAPDASLPTETSRVQTPPPPEPAPLTIEDRAQVYLSIGLDAAQRQLGGPVHAIEGMSPLFQGLALSQVPPFTDTARPVVRSVYMGPNESLILLDQQRVRPGAVVPALSGNSWRIGDVILYLHGEARPEVLRNLSRRVR